MSAVGGVFEADAREIPQSTIAHMLQAMGPRSGARVDLWRQDGAALCVSRHEWETAEGLSGTVGVLEEDDFVVAADASLYYRDDLRRALASHGVIPRAATPTHLILAAYRVWGAMCTRHIEGDYAFAIWNRASGRLFCARDFSGKRTLHFAELGGSLVVATTVAGVLAHPRCPADLDLAVVAQTAGALALAPEDTCYRAVRALPDGCSLTWQRGGAVHISRFWHPPEIRERRRPRFDDAAEELRALLVEATGERLVPHQRTAVYLSGGWDSTAVFGAGQAALEQREVGASGALLPVSISYPPGDPGREDELITAVAERWDVPVHWLDIRGIPLFDRDEERAATRTEPFVHPYEMWHRALARGCRAVGSHVALDGIGGDQLFQVSDVYLADLLARGHWVALAREWRVKGLAGTGFRNFFRSVVQPALPSFALHLAAHLRGGRPLVDYLERQVPEWLRGDFVRQHVLVERERALSLRRRGDSCAARETRWYLTYPYFARIFGCVSALNAEEGVETRSPLYDQRVITFALSRPRAERSHGRETKRLLRHAMRGLLPASVLASRPTRTGVTSGYFDRSMRDGFGRLSGLLDHPVLEELGIIDAARLRDSVSAYLRSGDGNLGVRLYFTLQTELWLRANGRSDGRMLRREVCAIGA